MFDIKENVENAKTDVTKSYKKFCLDELKHAQTTNKRNLQMLKDDVFESLTVPDIVIPSYATQEEAMLNKKHKHLGRYIDELRSVINANNDNA